MNQHLETREGEGAKMISFAQVRGPIKQLKITCKELYTEHVSAVIGPKVESIDFTFSTAGSCIFSMR